MSESLVHWDIRYWNYADPKSVFSTLRKKVIGCQTHVYFTKKNLS